MSKPSVWPSTSYILRISTFLDLLTTGQTMMSLVMSLFIKQFLSCCFPFVSYFYRLVVHWVSLVVTGLLVVKF